MPRRFLLLFGFLALASCGPVDLGTLAPATLEITSISEGGGTGPSPGPMPDGGAPSARTVSVGQTLTVRVDVTSRAASQQRAVVAALVFRRGDTLVPAREVTVMSRSAPVDLAAANDRATFEFEVTLSPNAQPGEWSVSAKADAAPDGGFAAPLTNPRAPEAAPSVRRSWRVQSPPRLQVGAFLPPVREFALPYLSVNSGCPLRLRALARNVGEATVVIEALRLDTEPDISGLFFADVETDSGDNQIAGGQNVEITAYLQASRDRTSAGSRTTASFEVLARDANYPPSPESMSSPLLVEQVSQSFEIVASPSRLEIESVVAESGRDRAAPGETDVAYRVRVLFRPGPGGAFSVDDARVTLRVFAEDAEEPDPRWVATADAANPATLIGCDPRSDCRSVIREYRITLTVPEAASGLFFVTAAIFATEDLSAPRSPVELCGLSDTDNFFQYEALTVSP